MTEVLRQAHDGFPSFVETMGPFQILCYAGLPTYASKKAKFLRSGSDADLLGLAVASIAAALAAIFDTQGRGAKLSCRIVG
jgi:hypothetical protein